jgi:hypothetical protein
VATVKPGPERQRSPGKPGFFALAKKCAGLITVIKKVNTDSLQCIDIFPQNI